jgi:hypothetical protein
MPTTSTSIQNLSYTADRLITMPTQNKSTNSIKANSLRSLMKGGRLSELINDAWEAPIGSTRRERAKAMFRSIKKANSNFYGLRDGKGGPGYSWTADPTKSANPVQAGPTVASLSQNNQSLSSPQTAVQGAPKTPTASPTASPTQAGPTIASADQQKAQALSAMAPGGNVVLQGLTPKTAKAPETPDAKPSADQSPYSYSPSSSNKIMSELIKSGIDPLSDQGFSSLKPTPDKSDLMKDLSRWWSAGKSVVGLAASVLDAGDRAMKGGAELYGSSLGYSYSHPGQSGTYGGYKTPTPDNVRAFQRLDDVRKSRYGDDTEAFMKSGPAVYGEWERMLKTYGPQLIHGQAEPSDKLSSPKIVNQVFNNKIIKALGAPLDFGDRVLKGGASALGRAMGESYSATYPVNLTKGTYKTPTPGNVRAFQRLDDVRKSRYGDDTEAFMKSGPTAYGEWERMLHTYGPQLIHGQTEPSDKPSSPKIVNKIIKALGAPLDFGDRVLKGGASALGRAMGKSYSATYPVNLTKGNYRTPNTENIVAFQRLEDQRKERFGDDTEAFMRSNLYERWERMLHTYGPQLIHGPSKDPLKAGGEGAPTAEGTYDATKWFQEIIDSLKAGGEGAPTAEGTYDATKRFRDTDTNLQEIIDSVERETGLAPLTPETAPYVGESVTTSQVVDYADSNGEGALDSFYNGMENDPSLQDYHTDVYEAIKSGESKSSFRWRIISDPEKLAKFLDVPEETLKFFPQNGMLQSHLLDIRDLVEDQYRLNDFLDLIVNRTLAGASIESNLQAWVRGKDEYLTKVDKLLFDTEERMANMDLSNPGVRTKMENYVNYLTMMKGRQNQRYIDYVQMSVDKHSADLDRLTALYELNHDKARKAFEKIEVMTTEAYENVKSLLDDVYDTAAKKEETAYNIAKMENDLIIQGQTIAMNNIKIEGLDVGIAGGERSEGHDMQEMYRLLNYDSETDNIPSLSNPLRVYTAALTSDKVNGKETLKSYYAMSSKHIASEIRSKNFGVIRDYAGIQMELIDNMDNATLDEDKILIGGMREEFNKAALSGISMGINNLFENNPELAVNIGEAAKDLTGIGLDNLKAGTDAKSKAGFIDKYSSELGAQIAEMLFDHYAIQRDKGIEARDTFNIDGKQLWELSQDDVKHWFSTYIVSRYVPSE